MRQRIEDLGRISVMLDNILENDIFCLAHPTCLDASTYESTEQACEEIAIFVENIKQQLYDIYEIAKGEDYLNEVDAK